MHRIMSLFIRWFYVYNSVPLHNGFIETLYINNKTIPHFVNIWSKEAIENISYSITVNQIDGYMDSIISPTSVRFVISRDKEINK